MWVLLFQTRDRVRNHSVGGALALTVGDGGRGGGSAQTMSFLERVAAAGAGGGNSCDPLKSVLSFSFPNKAVHSRWQN